ncbi:precursor of CEP14 [Argentina anserina]|uniref:precursor of CEP14 n=1 Tax=Argentina anserina TaxID=57926 RepID=UPI002176555A|nr:precursor of CEP14 [Potentilla anserina]
MARLSALAFVFLMVFAMVVSTLEGRRLLDTNEYEFKKKATSNSLDKSLFMSALPKGTVPASTPSKKGHTFVIDEKLIARRHLVGHDRFLQSVPSPGVGN